MTQEQEDALISDAKQRRESARQKQLAAAEAARLARETVPPLPAVVFNSVERECLRCGRIFSAMEAALGTGALVKQTACEACVKTHDDELRMRNSPKTARQVQASERWLTLCDAEFRLIEEGGATDPERLARDCPRLPLIAGWKYGPKGLMIRGKTGLCKTRAVWRLLRAQVDEGRTIAAVSSGKFARDCMDAAGNHRLSAWFDKLALVDVLFIDDLGKSKWTEFVWAQFFEVVDERAKHHRPIILTTNETRVTLEAKCVDKVTWEPLIRRIDENTESIGL